MILSASRRTDIPAYYYEWFLNRINEGYVLVRNPMNRKHVSKVLLPPDVVDCIVFWSKNPKAMMSKLQYLQDYKYYFQFTLTPYENDIELGLPDKAYIIETFKTLSNLIGVEKIIWRYDPILLNSTYTMAYHIEAFERIAKELSGYTLKVIISFIDIYTKIKKQMGRLGVFEISQSQQLELSQRLFSIADAYNIRLETCAENLDLSHIGINRAACIDKKLIESIIGYSIEAKKDKNQRSLCNCIQSIDIGAYNSCLYACSYCYANISPKNARENYKKHNPYAPLLIGELQEDDQIKERTVYSLKKSQLSLF